MYKMLVCELADVSVECVATLSIVCCKTVVESTCCYHAIDVKIELTDAVAQATGTSLTPFVREYTDTGRTEG